MEKINDILDLLDKIENTVANGGSDDLNRELEKMYAYYALDLEICKLTNKNSSEAKNGLRKVQGLMKQHNYKKPVD
ncbi:hypothetical protein ECANGB1_1556 [Enterospora canceri]|uniref:Uncharacterized protein n=1 Tax=Enterospora canceri TaxID=1081671 RepID=A0A1Y1S5U0_9MICR|nr:hypothetical protein ECANGB1_1556 [Enterospora canceri]